MNFKCIYRKKIQCTLKIINGNFYKPEENTRIPFHIQETNASLALAITEAFIEAGKIYFKKCIWIKVVFLDTNHNVKFSLDLAKKCIVETYWPGRYEIKYYRNCR